MSPAPGRYAAKTRYRQQDAACTLSTGNAPGAFRLHFAEPQWAVTPGQSAVLYDGEVCLGGGVITGARTLDEPTVDAGGEPASAGTSL